VAGSPAGTSRENLAGAEVLAFAAGSAALLMGAHYPG
jgi:hypothetical protein